MFNFFGFIFSLLKGIYKTFSIYYYDHAVTRYDDDPNINPQLTEFFFFKLQYILHRDSANQKFDHIIDHASQNLRAYEHFFLINSIITQKR